MTANENRRIKGMAYNKLSDLGFEVYASDSGDNIIIVSGDKEEIIRLLHIIKGKCALRRFGNKIDCFITLGKVNCKKLGILMEDK